MNGCLKKKVAIITGSGKGIGASVAKIFAAEGAKVVVATRTASSGQETVDVITAEGNEAWLYQVDVGNTQAVAELVDATVAHYGHLEIVVHNAAISSNSTIEATTEEALDEVFAVNLKACFSLARYAFPHMRQKKGGRILVTSSVTGPRVAMARQASYAASKAGVNGFIRSAAIEYASEHITVNGVEPGFIRTDSMTNYSSQEELDEVASYIPMKCLGDPEDVAYTMLFLASNQAKYITGQTIIVDGGSTLPESPVYMT